METHLLGFCAGALISVVTAPVGVSGAVFLLPVQLSVLHVPNPAVTPTNLLYNVVSGPGALLRYRRRGQLGGRLSRLLVLGTLPGVVVGAVIRVFAIPGPQAFRLLVGAFLLPLGLWLLYRTLRPAVAGGGTGGAEPSDRSISAMAAGVGVIGGIYGIGGGSILGPILAGRGMPMARVAPAALASTFVTSIVGALTYLVLSFVTSGDIAPHWTLGIACGLGGLVGGYVGARLQPRMPERFLRLLLGALACALAVLYLSDALR
ncbi:sulfite exporter TauE/SafE family protein [Actinocorallia sp. A-T 12471]|uniref:sulfite exporter TauE/SafE family protein n=1 Tax=Actinocorallia sp. A-T 12471 TaxID=3089813 RepID=UPI0029D30AFA|nr:sulfite exporter TauE/SafE family protein [Actinocorallia sp. A-T 12471]MDX6744060.1 sulfite exporter TauE/SafE family protein [Actinocorallia sp. A-T 12471]